ncbi:hypothetical protein [Streptomyces sp. NBRC 110028]|uniref:hypothetical protein n=1 Tax=Streptomyces sp. NBRC 110028 TaxID=1621260 RepID=UPI0006E42716|nr:hypothetical protein [Streptomyces sp. NBRC 110028]
MQDLRLLARFKTASTLAPRGDTDAHTGAHDLAPWRRVTCGASPFHASPRGHYTDVPRPPA